MAADRDVNVNLTVRTRIDTAAIESLRKQVGMAEADLRGLGNVRAKPDVSLVFRPAPPVPVTQPGGELSQTSPGPQPFPAFRPPPPTLRAFAPAPPPALAVPTPPPLMAFRPPALASTPGASTPWHPAPPTMPPAFPPAGGATGMTPPGNVFRVGIVSPSVLSVRVVGGQLPAPALAPMTPPANAANDRQDQLAKVGRTLAVGGAAALATVYTSISGLDAPAQTLAGSFQMLRNEIGLSFVSEVARLSGVLQDASRWVRTVNEATGGLAGKLVFWTGVVGGGAAVLVNVAGSTVSAYTTLSTFAAGLRASGAAAAQTTVAANGAALAMTRLNASLAANAVTAPAASAANRVGAAAAGGAGLAGGLGALAGPALMALASVTVAEHVLNPALHKLADSVFVTRARGGSGQSPGDYLKDITTGMLTFSKLGAGPIHAGYNVYTRATGQADGEGTPEQRTLASIGFQPQTLSLEQLHGSIQQEAFRGPLDQELLRQQVDAMRELTRALGGAAPRPNTNPPLIEGA